MRYDLPKPGGYELPQPDEWRDYWISYGHIRVTYQGVPPCLYCGKPVHSPSMDGPLVCGWCDMGKNPDGTDWTREERSARHAHAKQVEAEARESVYEKLANIEAEP